MHLTIQEFSKRTGLPPSKLRFYDKKKLLQPSTRLDNGYRAYTYDQIHQAKMIDSLRQADISIEDIKQYNEADEHKKEKMLHSWKKDLDKRVEVLVAARNYVGGIKVNNPQTLLLSRWEKEKHFVWQKLEVERSPHPFRNHFMSAKNLLEKLGAICSEEVYVINERITKDNIIGEIGFEVNGSFQMEEKEGFRYERVPPILFAVVENCQGDDPFHCFSYIQLVNRYGFQPAENKLERYSEMSSETFDFLIPLVM
ncbi:MerR family transcriptional regulator [Bacillus sp. 31A1R]|uniref:MerR family transcriptional regulator n=1 Tax=Robertmurraya mangrovi TaxID=3098077 RepID=A0ABU5J0F9_9BACI|nr:MerR family transcriptional regulator [Bacillus sp. 31A1R]MDZ5472847.1 MerR family transcriptional regulator [Bacillus sp. 31A1R]